MQIVIDIPQGLKDDFENERWTALTCAMMKDALEEGTVLPKGHGRLIDADVLMRLYGLEDATKYGNETAEQQIHSYDTMMMYEIADMIDDAPTIIEADKAESEDKE